MSPSAALLHAVVAGIVAWMIGALWYSPVLFAKAWVKAHGHTPEQVAAMQKNAPKAYGLSLVMFMLMAWMLGMFLNHLGADSMSDGVQWGFHAWLGFAVPLGFTAHLYGNKHFNVFLIDCGYQFVYILAMGAILGAWR